MCLVCVLSVCVMCVCVLRKCALCAFFAFKMSLFVTFGTLRQLATRFDHASVFLNSWRKGALAKFSSVCIVSLSWQKCGKDGSPAFSLTRSSQVLGRDLSEEAGKGLPCFAGRTSQRLSAV